MRRTVCLMLSLVLGFALAVSAQNKSAEKTITGELIDVACNTKSMKAGGEGTSSENHAECSYLCVSKGMPAGIKAADGVYWVVGKYTKSDNKDLLAFVNKQVRAVGPVTVVDGRNLIDVQRMELVKGAR